MASNVELAVLSEGEADARFLETLARVRGNFPDFFMVPHEKYHGVTGFCGMLKGLKGNPRLFERLKGVLIVADCKDNSDDTFKCMKKQVAEAGGFRVPTELLKVTDEPADQPGVFVMLLPDEKTPGALETLYTSAILLGSDWREKCLNDYLSCGKSNVLTWSAEKQAKARFHALVAASHEPDPSKAASKVFQSKDSNIIDLKAQCFDSVEQRLRLFCEAANKIKIASGA